MRGVFLIGGCVAALIAATFLPQVQDYREEKADAHIEQGYLKAAKRWSFYGKLQGDQKATNNYHVISFKMVHNVKGVPRRRYLSTRKKAFRAFDKLTQEGYAPGAYNAGMFYYRSSADQPNFKSGLMYFDHAAGLGDEMSRDAAGLMRARQYKKAQKDRELRKAADAGNSLAAYKYANNLRFDRTQLARAEKYAVLGAKGGYPDAQQFLASYFSKRKDAAEWLEKAATYPVYPSLLAASDLAELADKKKDYEAKRHWLTLGSTPREKFKQRLIIEPEGLRWRGLQTSILADVNNSKKAAYELARMQLDGIGGPVDLESATKNLEYADRWSDASILLAQVRSAGATGSKNSTRQKSEVQINLDLAKYDTRKNYPFYEKLRPFVKNKQIRYVTEKDLKKYNQGVSTIFSNKKTGFRKFGRAESCRVDSNCFYMEKPIILPADMNGAHSAQFLINPALYLPKQNVSHNRYIFLNERYVP